MKEKLYTNSKLIRAIHCSKKNRYSLRRSISCGCFSCETFFLANDIRGWNAEEDGELTAVCPYCGEDTVVGDDDVYPLKKIFLREMKKFWKEWK